MTPEGTGEMAGWGLKALVLVALIPVVLIFVLGLASAGRSVRAGATTHSESRPAPAAGPAGPTRTAPGSP